MSIARNITATHTPHLNLYSTWGISSRVARSQQTPLHQIAQQPHTQKLQIRPNQELLSSIQHQIDISNKSCRAAILRAFDAQRNHKPILQPLLWAKFASSPLQSFRAMEQQQNSQRICKGFNG